MKLMYSETLLDLAHYWVWLCFWRDRETAGRPAGFREEIDISLFSKKKKKKKKAKPRGLFLGLDLFKEI
jgi:hypothetical protein